MSTRLTPLLAICWLLSACSHLLAPLVPPPMPLQPPAELGEHLQYSQLVVLGQGLRPVSAADNATGNTTDITEHGAGSLSMLAAWSVTASGLDIAGLTLTGQKLLVLGYDGVDFTEYYSPLFGGQLPGRDIMSQLQLAYWPLDIIERQLQGSPWQLGTEQQGRTLYLNSRKALTIHRVTGDTETEENTLVINNYLGNYHLLISTLSRVVLP